LPLQERPSSAMNMSAIEKISGAAFNDAPPPPVIQRSAVKVVAGDPDRHVVDVEDTASRPMSSELSTESADDE